MLGWSGWGGGRGYLGQMAKGRRTAAMGEGTHLLEGTANNERIEKESWCFQSTHVPKHASVNKTRNLEKIQIIWSKCW